MHLRLLSAGRIVVLAVVFALALWTRWGFEREGPGSRFLPRPDALEYAASAQAIAQSFRFSLAVGPYQVRPRYPPGWPLVLAVAVRLGVPGEALWRIAGLLGAALASLLGLGALWIVERIAAANQVPRPRARLAATVAGLACGVAWAVAPVAVTAGSTVLSDEPTTLLCCVALIATAVAARTEARGHALAMACVGGFCLGLVATMRPISAILLLPPLFVLAVTGWQAQTKPRSFRWALWWGTTAALMPALTMFLLVRTGLSPWHWSGYDFWLPAWYSDLRTTFNLRYALHGLAMFPHGPGGTALPNTSFYGWILLGLPGLAPKAYIGVFWPAAAWISGVILCWHFRRRLADRSGSLRGASLAGLTLLAGHFVVFSLYFFPAARFMLLPMACAPLLLAVALGLAMVLPRGLLLRASALGLVLGWLVLSVLTVRQLRAAPAVGPGTDEVRTRFAAWQGLSESQRALAPVPFDPLQAQALGLLPPSTLRSLGAWGPLPPTGQVQDMRARGLIR